jgi:hypothetical protein
MQALRRALSASASSARRFTVSGAARVDDAATAAATKTFLEKFAQRAPSTMSAPSFPSEFRARPPRPPAAFLAARRGRRPHTGLP